MFYLQLTNYAHTFPSRSVVSRRINMPEIIHVHAHIFSANPDALTWQTTVLSHSVPTLRVSWQTKSFIYWEKEAKISNFSIENIILPVALSFQNAFCFCVYGYEIIP